MDDDDDDKDRSLKKMRLIQNAGLSIPAQFHVHCTRAFFLNGPAAAESFSLRLLPFFNSGHTSLHSFTFTALSLFPHFCVQLSKCVVVFVKKLTT